MITTRIRNEKEEENRREERKRSDSVKVIHLLLDFDNEIVLYLLNKVDVSLRVKPCSHTNQLAT